jgi:predicted nuclease of predicted toxin-antitoxin system
MKIFFDHGTPVPLRRFLPGHEVSTAFEMGWAELQNGDLLAAAEKDFHAFITTDKNLRYQQNLTGRRLAILILPTTSWPRIQQHLPEVASAVNALKPGDYVELTFVD